MAPDPLQLLEDPAPARVAERLVAEAQAAALAPPEGAAVVPLALRGRALSVLVFSAAPAGDVESLAARGAAALELAERYTDVLATARRHRACSAAAELQQDLMPSRIGRAAASIHGALCALELPDIFVSAVLATWDGPSSSLTWLRCGHPPPMVWHAERGLPSSRAATVPFWASSGSTRPATSPPRRSRPASSSSSSPTASSSVPRPAETPSARPGCGAALDAMEAPSATAATAAVLQGVAMTYDGPLRDDASVLVLAPH